MRSLWNVVLFLADASVASAQANLRSFRALTCSLLALASSAYAQADLEVTSAASPTSGLEIGSEVTVFATLRNTGTQRLWLPHVSMSLKESEPYWFEFVGTAMPTCDFKASEFFPHQFVYTWELPELGVGEQVTCAAVLRVRLLPPGGAARLAVDGDHYGVEEDGTNNHTSLQFFFGDYPGVTRHTVPAASFSALTIIAVSAVLLASRRLRSRHSC